MLNEPFTSSFPFTFAPFSLSPSPLTFNFHFNSPTFDLPLTQSNKSVTMVQSNSVSSNELNTSHQFTDKMITNGSFFIPEIKKLIPSENFQVGDKIYVNGVRPGVVRFLGVTGFSSGTWAGVELEESVGKNDGSVNGVKYFSCQPNHGIFVRPHRLTYEPVVNMTPSTVSSINGDNHHKCSSSTLTSSHRQTPVKSGRQSTSQSHHITSMASGKLRKGIFRLLDSSVLTKVHKHHYMVTGKGKDSRITLDQRISLLENEVKQLKHDKGKLTELLVDQLTMVKEDNGDLSDQVVSLQIDNIALHMRIDELNKLWTCNKLLVKTLELVVGEWRKDVQAKDNGNQALRETLVQTNTLNRQLMSMVSTEKRNKSDQLLKMKRELDY